MIVGNNTIAGSRRGWNPAALAGSTPTVRVQPTRSSIANGAEVDTIANDGSVGGAFSQSTSSLRPLMRRNYYGSKHAVDLDGSDDRLSGPAISGIAPASWTFIAVIDLDGLASPGADPWRDAALLGDAGGYIALTVRNDSGTPQCGAYRFRSGTQAVYTAMSGTGTRQVICAAYNNADGTLLAQAGLNAPATNLGTFSTTTGGAAVIGGFGPTYLNGKILELLAWGSFLNSTQRNAVIAGARSFYGA